MDDNKQKVYYLLCLAVAIGLVFHGASFLSTLEDTYDIYVHIFFGDHYSKSWFDPWEYRWYTGFGLTSYPPLLHQLIGLLSYLNGLKFATYILCFGIVVLYVSGSFRFAKLITANAESAGYAALIAVFLPSVIEAFHVFGQIPMMLGISWLLHALPEIYKFIRTGKLRSYLTAISLIAVAVCSHHVTPIFGMVFFVLPLMGTAILDSSREELGSYQAIKIRHFIASFKKHFFRITLFGFSTIIVTIFVILPYWLWSKSDPITQVPIPHGSRDSFIESFSSGLVFFIIPWGFLILLLPFFFYRFFSKRNLFLGLSFTMLFILGTGGTTPIPKMLLGENAFSILTLERFTFWATIYAMPLAGEFLWRFTKGDMYQKIISHRSSAIHSLYVTILIISIFFSAGFTTNLSFFRPLQPEPINLTPIKNFLQSDKHYKWRYLTLGFGDQMAWLSANTDALTIDGNYHSARRVPELTSRAIERLENAKYKGVEGIFTLKQFLNNPEKFHLKYVFSNDKFYDPALYFSGWYRVKLLDNGVMVWERSDVSPLPSVLPRKEIPRYQKLMWGIIPLLTLVFAFATNVQMHWLRHVLQKDSQGDYENPEVMKKVVNPILYQLTKYWIAMMLLVGLVIIGRVYWLNIKQLDHERVITSYYDAIDFKEFSEAYSFFDPRSDLSLDRFLLEISVTNGLLDSYGKIDEIVHETLEKEDDRAVVQTSITWVTPLKSVTRQITHEVVKKGFRWYLIPPISNQYIPTDQFSNISDNHFINQGRRKITTKETFHEDVLDRPVSLIRNINLVKTDSSVHVVGLVQNVDSYPVDLTIKASLLDTSGNVLTSYYDKTTLVHKLLPKELSGFRIDFDEIEWKEKAKIEHVSNYKVEVLGTVITQDLYKKISLMEVESTNGTLSGTLYNHGSKTSTVTQLTQSYFDDEGTLLWVDSELTLKSVFPKKSTPFKVYHDLPENLQVIHAKDPILTINGIDNASLARKYLSKNRVVMPLLIDAGEFQLLLHLNNFVGNPTPF